MPVARVATAVIHSLQCGLAGDNREKWPESANFLGNLRQKFSAVETVWRRGRDSLSTLSGKSWRFLHLAILACVYAGVEHIRNLGCRFHSFSYCP